MDGGSPEQENGQNTAWAAFDSLARAYDLWYQTPLGMLVDILEKKAIFSLAGVKDGEVVLDVGCGTGNYALELARRGARVRGIDPSAQMLEIARKKALEVRLPVEFTRGSVEELPFPDATFDLVTGVTMLEFTPSPKRAVGEMVRTLRPGGRVVIGVLNAWSLWTLTRWLEQKETVYSCAHLFSPPELVALLRPYGKVTWRTAVFIPPWHTKPNPRVAGPLELLERLLMRPFGAFIAARVVREQ